VSDALDALVVKLKDALLAALDACDPPVEVARDFGKPVYAGTNLSELLSEALTLASRERGGVEALVRHRPGCWEADHVRALAADG
jgi:hypothetical protein